MRLFTTYKLEYFRVEKISNHENCEVVSIENARVRTNMDHILVLSYIRHILDLRLY